MARLNLICNGMMFFNEVGDELQIVMPEIKGHIRGYCVDPEPTKDGMEWSPKLRQPVKAQISFNGKKSHEPVSKEVH
jgi:hypothetical protein